MRIVLVAVHPYPSPQAVPLANAFLQSYLTTIQQTKMIEIRRADFFLDQEHSECIANIVKHKPTMVGFSIYAWNRQMCCQLADKLRQHLPGVTIFIGGPEATADPRSLMTGTTFDFAISGEGEGPFAAVCTRILKNEAINDIPGVVTSIYSDTSLSPAIPLTDLNLIPSPWLNGTIDARNYSGILWQLARGCGFSCDFCFDSGDRRTVRYFSLARIEAELRHFVNQDVRQIFVLDSTFNQNQRRAKTILRMIKRIAPQIHFHFEVRSEFLDLEMAELFAGITCSLQIGLQSANPYVLKQVGRAFKREDFVNRIMLLNETGAVFGFDLIYGLPCDTPAGFRESLDFALSLYPNHLDIFPLAILPGTALAVRSESIGLHYLTQPPYTLISSPSFITGDMNEAHKLATACDIFYTRGRAVAWFNGITGLLGQRPTQILQRFKEWLEKENGFCISEANLSDKQIWLMQRDFLRTMFTSKRMKHFLPAVLDLVDYHYHYATALTSPLPSIKRKHINRELLQFSFRLAYSARLAKFNYEILEILEAGAADVRNFDKNMHQTGSWAVIYPTVSGVRTESLNESYFNLLKQLDGITPAKDVASMLDIQAADAHSFLKFALMEGIIELIEN